MFAQTAGGGSSAGTVGVLGDTPTTTSMLAALHDSFGVESAGAFDMNSFVDASAASNPSGSSSGAGAGTANGGGGGGTMFADFMGAGNGFDVVGGVGGGMGGVGAHELGALSDHSQGSEHTGHSQAGSAVHSQHGSPEAGLGAKEEPSS